MGIGGALAEARSEAGLTVTQVSERTRIRETIIRGIEHDDYSACGGDYYARGHIRAIARVVGTDPVPLIEEYDAAHQPPPELPDYSEVPPGRRLSGWHWLGGSGHSDSGVNGHDGVSSSDGVNSDGGVSSDSGVSSHGNGHDHSGNGAAFGQSARNGRGPHGTGSAGTGSAGTGSAGTGSAQANSAQTRPIASRPVDHSGPDDSGFGSTDHTALDHTALDDTGADDWPYPAGNGVSGERPRPAPDANAETDPDLYDPRTVRFGSRPRAARPDARAAIAGALESGARWADAARTRFSRPPEPEGGGVPGGITAAEAFRPAMPLQPRRTLSGRFWAVALIVAVAIALLIYFLVSGGSPPPARHPASSHHSAGAAASHRSATPPRSSASSSAPSSSAPPPTAAATLSPVSVAAFGPGGTAQGDNPTQASLAIDGRSGSGWHTDWYSSPNLSGMQSGTGLILDMGKSVRVTSATLLLGAAAGGTVQLRAGNAPALADLPVVAQAQNPGRTLTMSVSSPVTARYLLVWFTSLPPDNSGTYQAYVYNVRLSGTS